MIDSYEKFLTEFKISKEAFFEFGIRETILPSNIEKIDEYWEDLKRRIDKNQKVYIRGYGREAKGTYLYKGLYERLFKNTNVFKDSTNNSIPSKMIQDITGFKKNLDLRNYQVSHIFGKTKNIYLFEAPWNIAFVPKIIDPFTGHETTGEWPKEYQNKFKANVKQKYSKYIDEYNVLIARPEIEEGILEYINDLSKKEDISKEVNQFKKDILKELAII